MIAQIQLNSEQPATPRLFCCEDDFILFRCVTEITILFKFGVSSFLVQCTFEEILAAMQSRQTY